MQHNRSFNAIILDFKRLRQGAVTSVGFARFDLERYRTMRRVLEYEIKLP